MIQKIIGSRIALSRKAAKMTQDQLADAIGVHKQTISRWEVGKRSPTGEELRMMAETLDVSSDFLLGLIDTLTVRRD